MRIRPRPSSPTPRSRRWSARSAMRAGPRARTASASPRSGTGASRSTPRCPSSAKRATWLFIAWATSAETQARTSWKFAGPAKRSGVNRMSLWKSPEFAAAMQGRRRQFHRRRARIAASRTPTSTGVRACRSGRPSARRWPRHPVGAGRPEEAEGGAGRGAGAHRADHEGLKRGEPDGSRSAAQERRFALALLAPALVVLLLTTTVPLVYLAWSSLQRIDLSMPWMSGFAGWATTPRWAAIRASGIRSR